MEIEKTFMLTPHNCFSIQCESLSKTIYKTFIDSSFN